MFKLAGQIVRHKVGVVAVIAFAVVVFAGGEDEQPAKKVSPWSADVPAQVAAAKQPDEETITAKLGQVAVAAGEVAAEQLLGDKDLNPVTMGGDAVESFNSTNDAFAKANGSN